MMSTESLKDTQAPLVSLEQRRDTLYTRLAHGYDTIEQAKSDGEDVSHWEAGWLRLLREYERVCELISSRNS